jgi:hypothetical protein
MKAPKTLIKKRKEKSDWESSLVGARSMATTEVINSIIGYCSEISVLHTEHFPLSPI